MQARTGLFQSALGLLVLSMVSSTPPAFSQDTSQAAVTRKVKAKIDPKYPGLAKQLQLTGKVRIEVIVSPDGSVKNIRVVGGSPLLAEAAVDAIKQWKYESGPKETVETVNLAFENFAR